MEVLIVLGLAIFILVVIYKYGRNTGYDEGLRRTEKKMEEFAYRLGFNYYYALSELFKLVKIQGKEPTMMDFHSLYHDWYILRELVFKEKRQFKPDIYTSLTEEDIHRLVDFITSGELRRF